VCRQRLYIESLDASTAHRRRLAPQIHAPNLATAARTGGRTAAHIRPLARIAQDNSIIDAQEGRSHRRAGSGRLIHLMKTAGFLWITGIIHRGSRVSEGVAAIGLPRSAFSPCTTCAVTCGRRGAIHPELSCGLAVLMRTSSSTSSMDSRAGHRSAARSPSDPAPALRAP
jgi:hypothetical protein